MRKTAG